MEPMDPIWTVADTREWLLNDIESTATWRAEKAAEYPDDARNAQAAEGLTKLARWLRMLPEDHLRLVRLAQVEGPIHIGSDEMDTTLIESRARVISRFRFDDPQQAYSAVLDELITLYTEADGDDD